MTQEEYEKYARLTAEYKSLKSASDRLSEEKRRIDLGILQIKACYAYEIDYQIDSYFETKLRDVILNFYDEQIKSLEKKMEEL